ncbi:MAG: hypothetical protein KGQ58_08425 [Proteobacteria bacterium]|nr:hypothetical protein [Pseudomonadota bacterium]MDE2259529.1 hypothetical protein [Betaproteobacteria bacterium]
MTNKQPESRVIAGGRAAASFAETENGKPPGTKQFGVAGEKSQPRAVGFLNNGGVIATWFKPCLLRACGNVRIGEEHCGIMLFTTLSPWIQLSWTAASENILLDELRHLY